MSHEEDASLWDLKTPELYFNIVRHPVSQSNLNWQGNFSEASSPLSFLTPGLNSHKLWSLLKVDWMSQLYQQSPAGGGSCGSAG